jgi:hypothetical protein
MMGKQAYIVPGIVSSDDIKLSIRLAVPAAVLADMATTPSAGEITSPVLLKYGDPTTPFTSPVSILAKRAPTEVQVVV